MGYNVTLIGQAELEARIKKMANARQVFDNDFLKITRQSLRGLIKDTPRKTGTTARGWTTPQKLGLSSYQIDNEEKTTDGKYSIPTILDKGRGTVYPKNKFLYIPLSEAGRSKRAGAKIPSGLVFGVDYVFAKSSKATKGTQFIQKNVERAGKELSEAMIDTIRSIHGGS